MPFATLKYDLSNEEDRQAHADALNGPTMRSILWELDCYLRSVVKYDDKRSQKELQLAQDVRDKLWELLNESNIELL